MLAESNKGSVDLRLCAPDLFIVDLDRGLLKRLCRKRELIACRVLAVDEGGRCYFEASLQLIKNKWTVKLTYSLGYCSVAAEHLPNILRLKFSISPKSRFFAVATLVQYGRELSRSDDAVLIGGHTPPQISPPSVVAHDDTRSLVLVSVYDGDGFEDIEWISVGFKSHGCQIDIRADIELHRFSVDAKDENSAGVNVDHLVDARLSDIEYFTNIARLILVVDRSVEVELPVVTISVKDHFLGEFSASHRLETKGATSIPRLVPKYEPHRVRENCIGWLSAMKARRGSFPNSAVMLKRATLPRSRPEWMSEIEYSERFNHAGYGPYAIKKFPVTHITWSYCGDYAGQKQLVPHVNAAISLGGLGYVPSKDKDFTLNELAALDFDLRPNVIPSWKVSFPASREILSAVRPAYWALLEQRLQWVVANGVTSLQLDDYPSGGVCVTYGGDFSPECMRGFAAWLENNLSQRERSSYGLPADLTDFNYRDWLIEKEGIKSAREYDRVREKLRTTSLFRRYHWDVALSSWRRIRAILDKLSPDRYISLTSNGAPDWPAPEAYAYNSAIVDAMVAEIHLYPQRSRIDVSAINAFLMADGLGVRLGGVPKGEENSFFTAVPVRDLRRVHVAEAYALGHQLMVPWGNWRKNVKRLFPRWEREYGVCYPEDRDQSFSSEPPELLAPIYEFVVSHSYLFDGFEKYSNVGLVIRYRTPTIYTRFIVRELVRLHIQFSIVFADSSLHARTLDEGLARSFEHLIFAESVSFYEDAVSAATIKSYLASRDINAPIPRAIWCSNEDCFITIMQKGTENGKEVVIHLVNRSYDSINQIVPMMDDIVLRIPHAIVGPMLELIDVVGFEEDEFSALPIARCEGETIFRVKNLGIWGILRFAKR